MNHYAVLDCKDLSEQDEQSILSKIDCNLNLAMLNTKANILSTYFNKVSQVLPKRPVMLIVVINELKNAIDVSELLLRLSKHEVWNLLKLHVVLIDCSPIYQLFYSVFNVLEQQRLVEFNDYEVHHYENKELNQEALAKAVMTSASESLEQANQGDSEPMMWSLSPNSKEAIKQLTHSNYLLWYEQYMANQLLVKKEEHNKEKEDQLSSLSATMYL